MLNLFSVIGDQTPFSFFFFFFFKLLKVAFLLESDKHALVGQTVMYCDLRTIMSNDKHCFLFCNSSCTPTFLLSLLY